MMSVVCFWGSDEILYIPRHCINYPQSCFYTDVNDFPDRLLKGNKSVKLNMLFFFFAHHSAADFIYVALLRKSKQVCSSLSFCNSWQCKRVYIALALANGCLYVSFYVMIHSFFTLQRCIILSMRQSFQPRILPGEDSVSHLLPWHR